MVRSHSSKTAFPPGEPCVFLVDSCHCTRTQAPDSQLDTALHAVWKQLYWRNQIICCPPCLYATICPTDFPFDIELLARRKGLIIMSHGYKLQTTVLISLPVNQLIEGHRVTIGIKWDVVTITREIHPFQLIKDLCRRKKSDNRTIRSLRNWLKYIVHRRCHFELYLLQGFVSIIRIIVIHLIWLNFHELITLYFGVYLLTHQVVYSVCYCVNSFVHHVCDSELRGVSVWVLELPYIFSSITHFVRRASAFKKRIEE